LTGEDEYSQVRFPAIQYVACQGDDADELLLSLDPNFLQKNAHFNFVDEKL
jgi:hypothetical protein